MGRISQKMYLLKSGRISLKIEEARTGDNNGGGGGNFLDISMAMYKKGQKVQFEYNSEVHSGVIVKVDNVDFTYVVELDAESRTALNWRRLHLNYCDIIPKSETQ